MKQLRVRDIPPGVTFVMLRTGFKHTMIGQSEKRHQYRVIRHQCVIKPFGVVPPGELTINGQSYVKPVIRVRAS
ncbi:hypothetical protein SOASR031_06800 [Leminorella grimontii]|nr:hypothetical protein SOASR031_06800 [Leminorella grimontii]